MKNFNDVISWRTKKVEGGFEFRVISVGYQVDTIIHKTGLMSTRARAKSQAVKWVRYYKSLQRTS